MAIVLILIAAEKSLTVYFPTVELHTIRTLKENNFNFKRNFWPGKTHRFSYNLVQNKRLLETAITGIVFEWIPGFPVDLDPNIECAWKLDGHYEKEWDECK